MTRQVMMLYLIEGMSVGDIAGELNKSRAAIRGYLKEGGIILRPMGGVYLRGRDSVCDAVKRLGFESFHEFAQVKSLEPITAQASDLSTSERSLVRVYNAYRRLLRSLKAAGIVLPTSQMGGGDVERRAAEGRAR